MSTQSSINHRKRRITGINADHTQVVGYFAMGLTILIWVGFALTTRASHGSALAFGDVALARAIVPTLVFLPFIPSRLTAIRSAGWRKCARIFVGAGIPFFALAVFGGAATSATHVGTLIAGTVPVFVAVFMWASTGEKPSKGGFSALMLILVGACLLISGQAGRDTWAGIAALLCASLLWANYTIVVKDGDLDAIACAIVIAVPSLFATATLVAIGVIPTNWGQFSLGQAMPFFVVQGLGVGVVANLTYTFAIRRLGSAKCATLGACAPALIALSAVPVLGETLTFTILLAAVFICAGVLLFNRS